MGVRGRRRSARNVRQSARDAFIARFQQGAQPDSIAEVTLHAAEGHLGLVDGKIRMSRVTLRPLITLESGADEARARALVATAHESCFIANSVATPVDVVPAFAFAEAAVSR